MEQLMSFAGQNYFTHLITGFLIGGLPFLLSYLILKKIFKLSTIISAVIPFFVLLSAITLYSIFIFNDPPLFILTMSWCLLLFYIYKAWKSRS